MMKEEKGPAQTRISHPIMSLQRYQFIYLFLSWLFFIFFSTLCLLFSPLLSNFPARAWHAHEPYYISACRCRGAVGLWWRHIAAAAAGVGEGGGRGGGGGGSSGGKTGALVRRRGINHSGRASRRSRAERWRQVLIKKGSIRRKRKAAVLENASRWSLAGRRRCLLEKLELWERSYNRKDGVVASTAAHA